MQENILTEGKEETGMPIEFDSDQFDEAEERMVTSRVLAEDDSENSLRPQSLKE